MPSAARTAALATPPALAVLVGALVLDGCLSPQDIELEEAQPNEPPVIDLLSVRGPSCVSSDTGENLVFSVQVSDDNGAPPERQPLTARWFVDYDLTSTDESATTNDIVRSQQLQPLVAGETVAYPRAELSSGVVRGRIVQNPNVPHRVEVVISDGFDDDGRPRNRAVKSGAYAASYTWVVTYQQGGTCDLQ